MSNVSEFFGCDVFDKRVMKAVLSSATYEKLIQTINEGSTLDRQIADEVASAMKNWAVEKGATHFTHWFQPLTGITAEKHDSFISPCNDGGVIMEFSGKELIKGEPDASSFPSGGLRSTFEARGYTAWDPTSYAFIKGKTLCIPTAFCSYSGEALDKKTPLLRSMDALSKQGVRILRLLGDSKVKRVIPMVGAEQEYFLIDKEAFNKRKDLLFTGRTLFGAKPPKGQELDDHYFGVIKPRVQSFMEELNETLWRLGIPAKTEHNEVAPSQHELAPIYESCNIATDHNQLTMELMQSIASKHGLVCLLHEKPFDGVNGSGKHNNWSMATDTGRNLLSPGRTPHDNVQFLLFLTAVIKAVDDYQDLMRISVATAGNDHRLGASEAPPAIVSVFLGDELTAVLDALEEDADYVDAEKTLMKLGVDTIPVFAKDTTDRNRTSPFAFTGNKFEFRMLGSSNSIACANIMLNSAVADTLRIFADELESSADLESAVHELIKKTIKAHKRIIFNGNGYEDAWVKEAEKRGLCNFRTTPDCMVHLLDRKNREMLTGLSVFSEAELDSRLEIQLENYCKCVIIEANTMSDMLTRSIVPAISEYIKELAETAKTQKEVFAGADIEFEEKSAAELRRIRKEITEKTAELKAAVASAEKLETVEESGYIRDTLIPVMEKLRALSDGAEAMLGEKSWPFPCYDKLLFSVR